LAGTDSWPRVGTYGAEKTKKKERKGKERKERGSTRQEKGDQRIKRKRNRVLGLSLLHVKDKGST